MKNRIWVNLATARMSADTVARFRVFWRGKKKNVSLFVQSRCVGGVFDAASVLAPRARGGSGIKRRVTDIMTISIGDRKIGAGFSTVCLVPNSGEDERTGRFW